MKQNQWSDRLRNLGIKGLYEEMVTEELLLDGVTISMSINPRNYPVLIQRTLGYRFSTISMKAIEETKQSAYAIFTTLQGYAAYLLWDWSKTLSDARETIKAPTFSLADYFDERIAPDQVGEFYHNYLEFAGFQHIRAFSQKPEKFVDLCRPNQLTFTDMMNDVTLMDKLADYNPEQPIDGAKMQDLAYMSMCISGEAGEVANSCKKLIRDGWSEHEWNNLQDELVDVMIYITKLARNFDINLDAVWDRKHAELYERNELGPADEWLTTKDKEAD